VITKRTKRKAVIGALLVGMLVALIHYVRAADESNAGALGYCLNGYCILPYENVQALVKLANKGLGHCI
jgi:hypothetical protein